MKRIYAIVVTYNGLKWIDKCFGSLTNSSIPLKILVIDNGSTDDTPNIIREKYPEVEIIEAGKNLGFGAANNIGMRYAIEKGADYVFLLNQDAWIEKNTIEELLKIHKNDEFLGIISPMQLTGSGAKLDANFFHATIWGEEDSWNIWGDLYLKKMKSMYYLKFIMAASWLLPIECVKKVGLFNPLFIHYGEDDNYCQRVIYHGMKIAIVPDAIIYHDREKRKDSDIKTNLFSNKAKHYEYVDFLKHIANINNPFYKKYYNQSLKKDMEVILKCLFVFNFKLLSIRFNSLVLKMKSMKQIEKNRKKQKSQSAFLSKY